MKFKNLLDIVIGKWRRLKFDKSLFNLSLFQGILLSLIFCGYLVLSIIFNFSLGFKIIGGILLLLLWKSIQGMSWLNFYFIFLFLLSLSYLSLWFNKLFLIMDFIIFGILFVKKFIYHQQNSNQYFIYFIHLNWALMSYGLYFYANQPFIISLISYLIGASILSFYLFLLCDKKIQTNYFVWILIISEFYLLLNYLSLNGFTFSLVLIFLEYLLFSYL